MPILAPPLLIGRYPPFLAYGAAVTLNPSDCAADLTLSNGNLTVQSAATDSNWDSVRATASKAPGGGCWYWEAKLTQADNTTSFLISGGGNSSFSLTNYTGATDISLGVQNGATYKLSGGSLAGGGTAPSFSVNDVINFALDMNRGEIYIGKNGVYFNGADPSNRKSPTFTGITITFFAAASVSGSGGGTTGGDRWTMNFGATAFNNPPPL